MTDTLHPTSSTQYPISGTTQLLGVIGWPVSHTFSPAMHNAAIADLGLDFVYMALPIHPDDVATAVPGLAAAGFRGINITVPHKKAVRPLLHSIEKGAQAIGAVNTIVFDGHAPAANRRLIGYNTDWSGFLADLTELQVVLDGRDCLILGAGGAARAVAYGLAQSGSQVHVLARRLEQAETLVAEVGAFLSEDENWLLARPLTNLETIAADCAAPLIINATPLGMTATKDRSIWPDDLPFPAGAFVYDLVYNPRKTKFMQQAEAAGCTVVNGLGMLVHQGARAFELWTGKQPNVQLMRAVIE